MGDFPFASSEMLANQNTDTFSLVSVFPFSLLVSCAPFVCVIQIVFSCAIIWSSGSQMVRPDSEIPGSFSELYSRWV